MTENFKIGISVFVACGFLAMAVYFGRTVEKTSTASPSAGATAQAFESELHSLAGKIQAVKGGGKCNDDSKCHVVGLGMPTCGYYRDFLIYSTLDADETNLLKYVNEFNGIHEKLLNLNMASTPCGRKPASLRCVEQRCVPDVPEN